MMLQLNMYFVNSRRLGSQYALKIMLACDFSFVHLNGLKMATCWSEIVNA